MAQASHAMLVSEDKARLETREKLLTAAEQTDATGRAAFDSRTAPQDLYGSGYEKPLATLEKGPTGLLLKLVEALEGIVVGVGPMVEREAPALSSSAVTRIFSHLYLRDPSFDLGALLEPMNPELQDSIAEAMKDQVEALLQKFPAIDPVTAADGMDGGDVVDGGPPQVGNSGAQG